MDITSKATSLLNSLVGQKVTVFSGEQYSDTGMLDSFDDFWVRLRDDKGKHMYLGITQIRLIKPA